MDIIRGKVKEVFIPESEDISNPKNIGFRVLCSDTLLEIVVPVDAESVQIYKDDEVIITKNFVDNNYYYDIERYTNE